MNEKIQNQEPFFYQTGRTQPPKKRGGLFALVLVVFIFLSGIVSVLGLLNVRLFRKAQEDLPESSVVFFRSAENADRTAVPDRLCIPGLGVSGGFTDSLDQLLFGLPQGFYVASVEDGSAAAAKGLRPGDVIQSLDGSSLAETDSLRDLLSDYNSGRSVRLVIFRDGYQLLMDIAIHQ